MYEFGVGELIAKLVDGQLEVIVADPVVRVSVTMIGLFHDATDPNCGPDCPGYPLHPDVTYECVVGKNWQDVHKCPVGDVLRITTRGHRLVYVITRKVAAEPETWEMRWPD